MKTLNRKLKRKPKNYVIQCSLFDELNKLTSGFNEGELVVIAARPGVGKTTLSLELACLLSEFNPVLFESIEMTFHELQNKASKFYNLSSLKKLYINDRGSVSLTTIENHIKEIRPKFVFIDYLQIMSGKIKVNTKELKNLAKEYKCIIVLMSQLNRRASDKHIDLTMLRDSGTIEQDADQVWFITNKDLIIAKNRKGQTGQLPIVFYKEKSFICIDNEQIMHETMLYNLLNEAIEAESTWKFRRLMKKIRELDPKFFNKVAGDELLNYKNVLIY